LGKRFRLYYFLKVLNAFYILPGYSFNNKKTKNLRPIYATSIYYQNDKEGGGNKFEEGKNKSTEKGIGDLLSGGEGFSMPFKTEVTPELVPHHHYKVIFLN